jgi:aryl-alcohol dehydrogenase-like predicted oxidoreductase
MLPIPGTSKLAHVEENCAAAHIEIDDATYEAIDALGA